MSFIFALSITSTIVSHNKIFVFAFFSTKKPSPDWKGGAAGHRNEVRRLERKRNPGKRVKKDLLAFLPRKFSGENLPYSYRKKMTRPPWRCL